MAAGWSRIRIFNPLGLLINEIDLPTQRSWVLNSQTNGVGRCQFTVNVYDAASSNGKNPKCNISNFAYGNLILIEHKPSVNADGSTNGLLPPWVGIIQPPQSWSYGKVSITAYSAEWVLYYRPMGLLQTSGKPGTMVATILNYANNWINNVGPGIAVQPGIIDTGGTNVRYTFKLDGYSEMQNLSRLCSFDWDITPQVSTGGQLQLFLNWYQHKGIDSGSVISNLNMQNTNPLYSEQGQFFNVILGYTDAVSSGVRQQAISKNADSINANGILATKVVFPGTAGVAQDVLQSMTDAYLAQHQIPTRTFAPTLLDFGNTFSYCECGNTMIVQNDTVGFGPDGIGINSNVRITAVEYDDLLNSCRLAGVL